MFEPTLFRVEVRESTQGRGYWLDRPWLESRRAAVRDAEILIVPWENFREGFPALFPHGTMDFAAKLSKSMNLPVAVAIDEDKFEEISLYSKATRVATILVKYVALPTLAGALGTLLADVVKSAKPGDTLEFKLLIENDHGKCLSIDYKGPPNRALDTVLTEADRCLPALKSDRPDTDTSGDTDPPVDAVPERDITV